MSWPLTTKERDALDYLYGGGDETVECRKVAWVNIRYTQKCLSLVHGGPESFAPGTRMVRETAKVERQFGSCYTCEDCIKKADEELRR